jgi:4'-phosphopantetheinyl transferase
MGLGVAYLSFANLRLIRWLQSSPGRAGAVGYLGRVEAVFCGGEEFLGRFVRSPERGSRRYSLSPRPIRKNSWAAKYGGISATTMDKDKLHFWCAYPDDLLDEEAAQACARLLSDDERERWQRFKFEKHRREYLATHALARIALSHHSGVPANGLRFQFNEYGKPSIDPECGLRFNLSNSLGLVVCLISEGAEVGVDVESRARSASIAEVGPRMFSLPEREQLENLCEDDKPGRALLLWTLKEAYIKARGMGLALPLNRFSFLFQGANSVSLEIDPSLNDSTEYWRFCLLDYHEHCIAMMVQISASPELHTWEVQLPVELPRQIAFAQETWFPPDAN